MYIQAYCTYSALQYIIQVHNRNKLNQSGLFCRITLLMTFAIDALLTNVTSLGHKWSCPGKRNKLFTKDTLLGLSSVSER